MKLFDPNDWLGAEEICQVLGFGKRSVRYHCQKGHLERKKTAVGVRYRIDWSYFEGRQNTSGQAVSGKLPDMSGKAEKVETAKPVKFLKTVGGNSVSVSLPAEKVETLPEKLFESVPLDAHKLALEKISELCERNTVLGSKNGELKANITLLRSEVGRLGDDLGTNRSQLHAAKRTNSYLLVSSLVLLLATLFFVGHAL